MYDSLPEICMFTGTFSDEADFAEHLEQALLLGPRLVVLRCKQCADEFELLQLTEVASTLCDTYESPLLVATTPETFELCHADGLHLSSDSLAGLDGRPISAGKLLSVSCHSAADIEQAVALGADLLFLSPIKPTSSHPDLTAHGWEGLSTLVASVKVPVYALGGMQLDDLEAAKGAGAAGIALTSLWG